MNECKIAIIYFSATYVTKTYTEIIKNSLVELGKEVKLFNITSFSSRQNILPTNEFDNFVFGFPVFTDFIPSVIDTWLPINKGLGKRCVFFLTYGARTTGYAHFHTKSLLEQANFKVMFTAEFLGRHSFNVGGWRILPDRPNESDFSVAREFAALAVKHFSLSGESEFALQKPFGYDRTLEFIKTQSNNMERKWTHPVRIGGECCMCGNCVTECPNQAFNAETGLSDPVKCIECMHCVTICPDQVIKIDERMKGGYTKFLQYWHLTDEIMESRRSRIITKAWQTNF